MSGWRERRDPVRPRAVAAVVRGVRRSLRATHAVESVLLFVAGTLVVRAAMVRSDVLGPGTWAVALGCGVLAGLAWWLEHPVVLAATARRLDERLRHHGGLVTAFELEERTPGGRLAPMEELVRARVLARLRLGEALRALLPPLAVPISAPVFAGLLLLLASDARREAAPSGADLGALAAGLERALALRTLDAERTGLAFEGEDGGLSRAQVAELAAVLDARDALPRDERGWAADPDVAARVEALDRRVAELAREMAPESELRARLAEARTWLDALRTGLAGGARAAERGGAADAGGIGPLTAAAADGTMSGSPAVPGPDAMPPAPGAAPDPAAPVPGHQAGTWWPAEYDEVVAAWVELSRAARAEDRGGAAPR